MKWLRRLLARLFGRGKKPKPPPAPPAPKPERISLQALQRRQQDALERIVLYPRKSIQPFQWAVQEEVVFSRNTPFADLPVDYWRWPYVVDSYANPADSVKGWAEKWLQEWLAAGRKDWWGGKRLWSLNHQLCVNGGMYFAEKILGQTGVAEQRIMDVLRGQWWERFGQEVGNPRPSPGNHGEIFSRHYSVRNIEYLWALADYADNPVAKLAADELDIAMERLRPGIEQDGIWFEPKIPRHRANKDSHCFPHAWQRFALTAHPGQTPVLSYLLFGTEWRPEFQGHHEGDCDERHSQWMAYCFLAGKRWRPRR